ncbi:MAG: 1-acyl-sn-glycerol-3-phosphate acyltransferase [Deltaproteobacteria bacterium]|nr:1-acyl-sn-glycerol-3-phosphate acyltransferase [Deltaproteobacteria bacterium]
MRFSLRTMSVIGCTVADFAGMELTRLVSPSRESTEVTRRWMRRYGRQVLRLLGGRVLSPFRPGSFLPGQDASGVGRVFVMNHRSMLDVFVYLSFVEANALSRGDLAGWPIIGPVARRVGTVFVDRQDKASGSAAVAAMTEALRGGRGILVFPEGTTFLGDEVRPFRAGAFVAAERARAEVVPLGIAYQSEAACYGDESFGAHWRRLGSMPEVLLALEPGEPILPDADPEKLKEQTRDAVQALVRRARARLEASPPGNAGVPAAVP